MEELDSSSTTIAVNSFVAARAQEIVALSLQIGASSPVTSKRLAFQHVPMHMRRRAVSHDVKRLPKRLQQAHLQQLVKSSGGPQKKPKTPSRKHRRRKSNLLLEYNRRQRDFQWLETHIWHSKRFHMDAKWDHKIPIAPCDKGYRAIYRSFRDYAAMRDISFYSCLEIKGPHALLCEKFRRITFPGVDTLGIGALYYIDGHREGHLHIYHELSYPYGYIGEVSFFWVQDSILWLWVHPGYKTQVLDQLVNIFNLTSQFYFPRVKVDKDLNPSLDQIKLQPKNLMKPPRWTSNGNKVTITDLNGGLNRIRLFGEETFTVLKTVLNTKVPIENEISSDTKCNWFSKLFNGKESILKLQNALWNLASNSHDFPCQTILPLVVRDPRIFLPQSRTKNSETENTTKTMEETDELFLEMLENYFKVAPTPLANSKLRERILKEKMSDKELSTRRGELLIPGSELNLGDEENQVPILLIRQPGSGWDIILPAGWCMAFWISLSYRCVRAFGYRDAIHHAFEFGSVHSTELVTPDSYFGQQEVEEDGDRKKETFFCFPPAKRSNLVLLKCPFPFGIKWELLLNHWHTISNSELSPFLLTPTIDFFVLRDTIILKQLSNAFNKSSTTDVLELITRIPERGNCLIGIGLKMIGKGKPGPFSIICIPENENDIMEKCTVTVEPPQDCRELEMKRKELRQKHQKMMAFLRKKRSKLRKRENNANSSDIEAYDSTALSENYNAEAQALFLPSPASCLKVMSRVPLGFVTVGGDSYRAGKSGGFGYITLLGFQTFLENVKLWKKRNIVLIRDASCSLDYKQAKLEIFPLFS